MSTWTYFDISTFLSDPAVSDAGNIAVVSRNKDVMELWYIAPDGSIQDNYWYPDPDPLWHRVEIAPSGSANPTGGIAAVSRIESHMEVWWIGPEGSVEGAYFYQGAAWTRYQLAPPGSAAPSSSVHALSRIETVLNVWWIGPKGSVEGCYWVYGADPGWTRYQIAADGAASLGSGLTGVSRIPTHEEIWWVSPSGTVEGAFWYEGMDHRERYQLASEPLSASVNGGIKAQSRLPGGMDVFWSKSDGSVQSSYYDSEKWTTFELSPAGTAYPLRGLTVLTRRSDHMEAWWIGPLGEVKNGFWYQGMDSWNISELAPAGSAKIGSNMASIKRMEGAMEVFYSSQKGGLQERYWLEAPAKDPPAEDPPAKDPPVEDPPAKDPPAEDPPVKGPPTENDPAGAASTNGAAFNGQASQ